MYLITRPTSLSLLAAASLAILGGCGNQPDNAIAANPDAVRPVMIGQTAPPFELTAADGSR